MKNNLYKSLLFIISLLFFMAGCNNTTQSKVQQTNSSDKVALTISATVKSRAAVSDEDELNYYKSLSYTLTAVDDAKNEIELLKGVQYSDLQSAKPEIVPGNWIFTLFANDEEETILVGTKQKTVSAEDSFIEFTLGLAEGLTGSIELKVYYGSNYISYNDNNEPIYPEFTTEILYSTIGNKVYETSRLIIDEENSYIEDNGHYYNTYTVELPVGSYKIRVLYNGKVEDIDLFYVSPNLTTCAEFHAGKPFVIKNNSSENNYKTEISFNKITSDEVSLFKGNKVSVTISGYPNKDFNGNLNVYVYGRTESDWYERGSDVKELSLQKDTFFSSTFDIVIRNTYGNLTDQGVGLLYFSDALDDALTINEFNIVCNDAADFDVTTYKYHQGKFTVNTDCFKTGNEYTVLGSDFLDRFDSRYVEGWYDNPEFDGDPITTIVADENMDLYAKYAINIRKIADKDNLYSSDILLDELFAHNSVVPQRNKYFTVTTKGTLKALVDGEFVPVTDKIPLDFYLFNSDNYWTEIEEVREDIYYEPNANGYFELTTKILVPSDFDYQSSEQLGITYGHNTDGFNGPLYIFDFDISAAVEVYEKAERELASVETCDDGVKFTIQDYSSVLNEYPEDFVHYVQITEKTTGTSYKINEDTYNLLNNGQSIEFVYPLLEPDKVYYFDVNIATYRDHNTFYSDLPCISGENSLGVLNYEALDELSAVMTSDDDGRYVKINNASTDIIKSIFESVDFEIEEENIKFDFSILAGDKNWIGNTQWLCGRSGTINDLAEYQAAISDKGLNYLVNDYGWSFHELDSDGTLKYINDTLAEHGTGWWDFGYRFALDDYPEGEFITRMVSSEITPYEKFVKEITVTYDLGYETTNPTEKYNYGDIITVPSDPSRPGYEFIGWTDSANAEFEFSDFVLTENITIFANWIPKYTLTLNTGVVVDGVENVKTFVEVYEAGKKWSITEEDCPSDESTKVFLGWSTEANATTTEYDKTFDDIPVTGNLTLYAVWTPIYTLTLKTRVYNDEGEENCIPFEVVYEPGKFWEITDGDYPIDEDSRIFLGWATESDATTAEYDKAFNNIPVEGNLTLYAVWTPKYTLTLKTGVIENEEEITKTFVEVYESGITWSITEDDCPADEGTRVFLGWSTEANATTAEYDKAFNNIPVEGNLTLYAVWEDKATPSIDVVITIPETNTLEITQSTAANTYLFTVEDEFESYQWYLAGELLEEESNELTLDVSTLDEGIYQITCLGIKGTTTADGYVVITINK